MLELRSLLTGGGAAGCLLCLALTAGRQAVENRPDGTRVKITIDTRARIGTISPYIYGMAGATPEQMRQLHVRLNRWGGNPSTRYNWVLGNCWNAARDWEFRNGNYNSTDAAARQPSGVADRFVRTNRQYGCDTLLTIPTLGWVARDDRNATASRDVPAMGGPPVPPGSEAIAGYDPAANRRRVSWPSLPRKGRPFQDPPDIRAECAYQDEWVYHLTRRFGTSGAGGIRYYALDNEPDLWDSTHTDMHPVQADDDEMLRRFLDYATAIKDVDPSAQVTGPVCSGWLSYFFSSRDRGTDRYATHADRNAHGGLPFVPWFLRQVARHDARIGRRTLDLLDVHYYPQAPGVYSNQADAVTGALRLRSTRSLWDPTYMDESWIDAPVQLIPRLRQWVQRNYPGTRIGITEWNWGAERSISGGLAVAEVLGILGREQVDLACYWTAPPVDSPAFHAFQLYRNADGRGHGFGDLAVRAGSSDAAGVSCYAALETQTGELTLLVINKRPTPTSIDLHLGGITHRMVAEGYRFDISFLHGIRRVSDTKLGQEGGKLDLPAESVTLLRCHRDADHAISSR